MDEINNIVDEVEKVTGEVVTTDDAGSEVSDGIQTIILNAGSAEEDITKLAVIVGTAAGIGACAVCGGLVWAGKKLWDMGKNKVASTKQKKADKKPKKEDTDDIIEDDNTSDDTESDEVSDKKTSNKRK